MTATGFRRLLALLVALSPAMIAQRLDAAPADTAQTVFRHYV